MKRSLAYATAFSIFALQAGSAEAGSLPPIKANASSPVPQCATPGRLMVFLAQRNPRIDPRYAGIATMYMRHGEELGLRWDYAFYQMMLETGSLSYTRDGTKPGDVKPRQNNFAGLGATGRGAPGESFQTIEDGVKAHLQHLAMYAGEHVDAPVAERTRKVQEWGVLTSWQKGFKRPITFTDLAAKWAPGSRGYARDIESLSQDFNEGHCSKPDPRPELVQEAREGRSEPVRTATRQKDAQVDKPVAAEKSIGTELARRAVERARAEGDGTRSALGGQMIAAKPFAGETAPAPAFTILNDRSEAPAADATAATAQQPATAKIPVQTASAAASVKPPAKGSTDGSAATTAAAKAVPPAADPNATAAAGKCRVFTASYGGQKAVIIRANGEQFTNFTVLDVNEGQESREIDAYISAYAAGGQKVGEFSNSETALDKAFQLCPEG